jgi:hypothetical protein
LPAIVVEHIADRPFSFEPSADDAAALLDYLHVKKADLFGFSNGGTIALQVSIRHPDVVRKLPGTDHMEVTARTELLVPMIDRFLDEPAVK